MDQAASSITSLGKLAQAEADCRRCPLYRHATQAVPGEGPKHATLMLVGEQPGDKEDLAGKPFVGPAGRVLDQALADAGIDRKATFVTGAVKHFKHEMRGKRRLHKRPNNYEIERCKIWLDEERRLVKPKAIIALGVTAARADRKDGDDFEAARQTARSGGQHQAFHYRASGRAIAHQRRRRQACSL